jgi:hypothetical protein
MNTVVANRDKLVGITLPSGLEEIGLRTFYDYMNLTHITLPDTLKTIGGDAFRQTGLVEITIPRSVESIISSSGGGAFADCLALERVVIQASIAIMPEFMFRNCSKLEAVTLPNGVTTISQQVFTGCSALTTINIPSALQVIGAKAFNNCSSIGLLTLPASVSSIATDAFTGCPNISFALQENSTGDLSLSSDGMLLALGPSLMWISPKISGAVEIPSGVTAIPNSFFMGISSITSVSLPDSLTTIGLSAFQNCTGITSITIPAGVTTFTSDRHFNGCTGLTEVIMENPVPRTINTSSASMGTFGNCPLAVIYVPDNAVVDYQLHNNWKNFKDSDGNSIIKGISQRPDDE